ncbi:hypothetical protein [Sinomonas gamaensis]|uniref:hypothetical protein n=1 Tax=Sinomonas gamaensis TaxID=2565624 RepID=UPI0011095F50|nr:hypothetical protein [Sinomonas gamaensis]
MAKLIGQYSGYLRGEVITVCIYDRLTDGNYRYTIDAWVESDPTRRGFGNGCSTIDEALATYHWDKLKG